MRDNKEQPPNLKFKLVGLVLFLLLVFLIFIAIMYFLWSAYYIVYLNLKNSPLNLTSALNFILNFTSLLLEVFGVYYTIMIFYHMANASFNSPLNQSSLFNFDSTLENTAPELSILIPIRNAEPKILDETLSSIDNSTYPKTKLKVLIGDDSSLGYKELENVKQVVKKYDFNYYHMPSNKKFKAGMLNLLLHLNSSKYVIFLDYDHVITPDFPIQAVALLEKNPNISFVQAKVNFRSINSSLQKWESLMYLQFFEIFNRSKHFHSKVIFNGSTACFRRDVLTKIGGIPTYSFTEDLALTALLLSKGYQSALLDSYSSFGLIPVKFDLLVAQLLRWAKGQTQVLKKVLKDVISSHSLSLMSKIDLLFSLSLFLVASSMYVNSVLYLLMFMLKIPVIRPSYVNFPILLLIPISFSIAYYLTGVLSLYLAKDSTLNIGLKDLFFFYFYALILAPFSFFAVVQAIIQRKEPSREREKWNRIPHITVLSTSLSLVGLLMCSAGIIDLVIHGFLGQFWGEFLTVGFSMFITLPVTKWLSFKYK